MALNAKATWTKQDGEWMIRCTRGEEGDVVAVRKKGTGASYKTLGKEIEPGVFRSAD